jgi:hypothetical protein
MRHTGNVFLSGTVTAVLLIGSPASAQAPASAETKANLFSAAGADDAGSALDCPRPEGAKEAKVIDFDPGSSTARLAVNVGSGRFTLVTIKTWDRAGDPRPLTPIIHAAKIMQGKLQFFSRKMSADPASAPDEYLIMTEMGGGYVCWAKPSWLMQPPNAPVADATGTAKPAAPAAVVTPTAATDASEQNTPAARAAARRPATWIRDGVVVRDPAPR